LLAGRFADDCGTPAVADREEDDHLQLTSKVVNEAGDGWRTREDREQDLGRVTVEVDVGYAATCDLSNAGLGLAHAVSRQDDPLRIVNPERNCRPIAKPQENHVPAHSAVTIPRI